MSESKLLYLSQADVAAVGLTMRQIIDALEVAFKEKINSFTQYQKKTGLDKHSLFAKPRFIDAPGGDYRLAPDSPGVTLGPGGAPTGAALKGPMP